MFDILAKKREPLPTLTPTQPFNQYPNCNKNPIHNPNSNPRMMPDRNLRFLTVNSQQMQKLVFTLVELLSSALVLKRKAWEGGANAWLWTILAHFVT